MLKNQTGITCNRLRIDVSNGSVVVDYRIENGRVERRITEAPTQGRIVSEVEWQRLTPEQLCSEILAQNVVARWLFLRLGLHALIRACSQRSSFVSDEGQEERRHVSPDRCW